MTNALSTETVSKPPRLHVALRAKPDVHHLAATNDEPRTWPIWSLGALALVALFVASVSEYSDDLWPVLVILAVPVLALWLDAKAAQPSLPAPKRSAKPMVDRRHVLMRAVLVLPQGRPNRIIGEVPRQIQAAQSRIKIADLPPRREPRLLARHRTS
jgi:hypothetical protein